MQTNPPSPEAGLAPVKTLTTAQGREIYYTHQAGYGPTALYLPGYASDMTGTKARFVAGACEQRGQAYACLDYSGVGRSPGAFGDGTISRWVEDTLAVIDQATAGPLLLIGSSMGGWIGLHCALRRKDRVKAFIGIAAAPDFTRSIWDGLTDADRALCHKQGFLEKDSSVENPLRLYAGFIDDGNGPSLLLDKTLDLDIPVTLLQGKRDADVPWPTAAKIRDAITPSQAEIIYVEDGDHRLARPQDLDLLDRIVREMSARIGTSSGL